MSNIMQETKKHLLATQIRHISYADTKRREIFFDVGTQVLLNTSNIKLLPRWIGHFKVLNRVGKVDYKSKFPETLIIHDVFHISLL
jgi:hypothetical protein